MHDPLQSAFSSGLLPPSASLTCRLRIFTMLNRIFQSLPLEHAASRRLKSRLLPQQIDYKV